MVTSRRIFSFGDFIQECELLEGTIELKSSRGLAKLGAKVVVPDALMDQFPFNTSAYDFLQFFREEIFQYGIIEFPNLPVNLSNYTVAMRAPEEHQYSANPYLTESCQTPHQDTPPYPTAFWLGQERMLSATWVMTDLGAERFFEVSQANRGLSVEEVHQRVVPKTLNEKSAVLLNHTPGLLLIDNSQHHQLYHAKTCRFENRKGLLGAPTDNPMYTFNEVGLLQYIDSLDEQRGRQHRNSQEVGWVRAAMG